MKILFETSECAPFSKSGGLADVAFSLPPELKKIGHKIAIITPLYQCVKQKFSKGLTKMVEFDVTVGYHVEHFTMYKGKLDNVHVYFLGDDGLFDRPKLYGYDDDKYRFAFFSKACIDAIQFLPWVPDILHCNDWETALSILYLKDHQAVHTRYRNIKTVYTIHNIAYQGQYGRNELYDTFGLVDGWYDGALAYNYQGRQDINLMKGAMLMADAVSTVSQTYANELHTHEFGMGLEGVVDMIETKLYGILNGINMDHYNPENDTRLVANFNSHDMTGKYQCKYYLQDTFGLKREKEWPLFCVVARLVEQKGIELIKEILPQLIKSGIQIIIFGQGDQKYINYFETMAKKYPGQLGFSSDYTEEMAARIFAGSEFYLMPSRFEPCGLSQMMAMRYGTVPIVHETGGLKDSVRAYSEFDGLGDGFSFSNYSGKSLYLAILQAVKLYFGDRNTYRKVRERCFNKDFSWKKSALMYEKMYSDIVTTKGDVNLTFEDAYNKLFKLYKSKALIAHRMEYISHQDKDFKTILQVRIEGPGEGTFSMIFTKAGLEIEPNSHHDADVKVSTTFDNLVGMVNGTVDPDKLFISGQLKVRGNVSKGAEMRYLIGHKDIKESL